jgi:hypothetical protein
LDGEETLGEGAAEAEGGSRPTLFLWMSATRSCSGKASTHGTFRIKQHIVLGLTFLKTKHEAALFPMAFLSNLSLIVYFFLLLLKSSPSC